MATLPPERRRERARIAIAPPLTAEQRSRLAALLLDPSAGDAA
jgi:hypothetical protein